MTHVEVSRGVGKHVQHILPRTVVTIFGNGEGFGRIPVGRPFGFEYVRVIASLAV
jgi:hypothetical protein